MEMIEYEMEAVASDINLSNVHGIQDGIRHSIIGAFQTAGRWNVTTAVKLLIDMQGDDLDLDYSKPDPNHDCGVHTCDAQYYLTTEETDGRFKFFRVGRAKEYIVKGGWFRETVRVEVQPGVYRNVFVEKEHEGIKLAVVRAIRSITVEYEEKTGADIRITSPYAPESDQEITEDNPIPVEIDFVNPFGFVIYNPSHPETNIENKDFVFNVEIVKGNTSFVGEVVIPPVYISISGLEDPFIWIKSENRVSNIIRECPYRTDEEKHYDGTHDTNIVSVGEENQITPATSPTLVESSSTGLWLQPLFNDMLGTGEPLDLDGDGAPDDGDNDGYFDQYLSRPFYHQTPLGEPGISFICRLEGGHYVDNPPEGIGPEDEFACSYMEYNGVSLGLETWVVGSPLIEPPWNQPISAIDHEYFLGVPGYPVAFVDLNGDVVDYFNEPVGEAGIVGNEHLHLFYISSKRCPGSPDHDSGLNQYLEDATWNETEQRCEYSAP